MKQSTHIYSYVNNPRWNCLIQQHGLRLSTWISAEQPVTHGTVQSGCHSQDVLQWRVDGDVGAPSPK